MLEHSNTLENQDILSLAATFLSHEKKSSEDMVEFLSIMKHRVDSHSELINSLLSMSEHSFSLGSFAHVIETLYSQSEEIANCLMLLSGTRVSIDEPH